MAFNLSKLFVSLQLSAHGARERAILSLVATKAFDSVEWNFLWAVLLRLGFDPQFLSWVHLLYSGMMARIRTGGLLSSSFELHKGTR